jgi:hypothetical protein
MIRQKRLHLKMNHYTAFLKRASTKGVLQKFAEYFAPPEKKLKSKKDKGKGRTHHGFKK